MSFTQQHWTAGVKRYQAGHSPATVCEILLSEQTVAACFMFPSHSTDNNYCYANRYLQRDESFRPSTQSSRHAHCPILCDGVTRVEHDLLTFYHVICERDGCVQAKEASLKLLAEMKNVCSAEVYRLWVVSSARVMGITSQDARASTEWYCERITAFVQHVLTVY